VSFISTTHHDADVQDANARLIAAAPDLPEALEACERRRTRAEGDSRSSAKGSSGIPGGYLTKRLIRVSSNALPRFLAL
jgi:hypothetical protein